MIDAVEFAAAFTERFGGVPRVFSAPGRVNLIGEHTDYNEGFVLPFAIDKRTFVGINPRSDGVFKAHTRTLNKSTEFTTENIAPGGNDWSVYIRGMIAILREMDLGPRGADILIDSDVPFGAGLSSSAALEIALAFALCGGADGKIAERDMAFAGQRVEHEFIGVRSGIMDQFASALSESGNALLIDCRSFEVEQVPLELPDAVLAICDTRVKHSLASSEYNRRREECEEGVKVLKQHLPEVLSLRDVSAEDLERFGNELSEVVRKRCRHVVSENGRTLAAVAALRRGDLIETGRLMFESHQSLELDYEVSCPELDLLAHNAMEIPGVFGSRMTGGGFGGCTISLLEKESYETFVETMKATYNAAFDREPEISVVVPSDGAREELL